MQKQKHFAKQKARLFLQSIDKLSFMDIVIIKHRAFGALSQMHLRGLRRQRNNVTSNHKNNNLFTTSIKHCKINFFRGIYIDSDGLM